MSGLIPTLVSEGDMDTTLKLCVGDGHGFDTTSSYHSKEDGLRYGDDHHVSLYDFLYILELLGDSIDIQSLSGVVDMDKASDMRVYILLQQVMITRMKYVYDQRVRKMAGGYGYGAKKGVGVVAKSVGVSTAPSPSIHTLLLMWLCAADYHTHTHTQHHHNIGTLHTLLTHTLAEEGVDIHDDLCMCRLGMLVYEALTQTQAQEKTLSQIAYHTHSSSPCVGVWSLGDGVADMEALTHLCRLAYTLPLTFFPHSHAHIHHAIHTITLPSSHSPSVDMGLCVYTFHTPETCARITSSYTTIQSMYLHVLGKQMHVQAHNGHTNPSLSLLYHHYKDYFSNSGKISQEKLKDYCLAWEAGDCAECMSTYDYMLWVYILAYYLSRTHSLHLQYAPSRYIQITYTIFMDMVQMQEVEVLIGLAGVGSGTAVEEKGDRHVHFQTSKPSLIDAIHNIGKTPSVSSSSIYTPISSSPPPHLKKGAKNMNAAPVAPSPKPSPPNSPIPSPKPKPKSISSPILSPIPAAIPAPIPAPSSSPKSTSSSAMPPPSPLTLLLLLLHYPHWEWGFNPWTILSILKGEAVDANVNMDNDVNSDRYGICNGQGVCDAYDADLPTILKRFSSLYNIPAHDLSIFFAHSLPHHPTLTPLLIPLLSHKVMAMCLLNHHLLQHEYGMCYGEYGGGEEDVANNPFLKGVCRPFLSIHHTNHTHTHTQHTLLTPPFTYTLPLLNARQIVVYARTMFPHIPQKAIQSTYSMTTLLAHTYTSHLTYSTFILFILRCCLHGDADGHAGVEDRLLLNLRTYLGRASENLTRIQQQLQLHILPLLYTVHTPVTPEGKQSMVAKSIQNFSATYTNHRQQPNTPQVTHHQLKPYLPPRPPPAYIDVCRYMCYLRMANVHHSLSLSLTDAWCVYGVYLKQIQLMGDEDGVVMPIPIPLNPKSVMATFDVMLKRYGKSDSDVYAQTLLPILVANVHAASQTSHSNAASVQGDSGAAWEDMCRYGGHSMVHALLHHSYYLQQLFQHLVSQSHQHFTFFTPSEVPPQTPLEVPIHLVSACLSCQHTLLDLHTISMILQASIHPRHRPLCYPNTLAHKSIPASLPSETTSVSVPTLSYIEFEESVVRCAFTLWVECKAIVATQAKNQMQSPSLVSGDGKASLSQSTYTQLCKQHLLQEQGGVGKGWGKDFLAPYILTLQHVHVSLSIPKDNGVDTRQMWQAILSPTYVTPRAPTLSTSIHTQPSHAQPLHLKPRVDAKNELIDQVKPEAIESQHTKAGPKVFVFDNPTHTHTDSSLAILSSAKESLWPIFATYCSCGDSVDPGKLSGPNLVTLLSALGVLGGGGMSDQYGYDGDNGKGGRKGDRGYGYGHGVVLSSVGILFHQIAMRSLEITPITSVKEMLNHPHSYTYTDMDTTPSLTFEEFLIFLFLFSHVKYEGHFHHIQNLTWPKTTRNHSQPQADMLSSQTPRSRQRMNVTHWFQFWTEQMVVSVSFQRLLKETIMPIVSKQTLLAYPEDARERDKYAGIFSVEVLGVVEDVEKLLFEVYREKICPKGGVALITESEGFGVSIYANIVHLFNHTLLIPHVVTEEQVMGMIKDILPKHHLARLYSQGDGHDDEPITFPQWEWMVCVMAFCMVEKRVRQEKKKSGQGAHAYQVCCF